MEEKKKKKKEEEEAMEILSYKDIESATKEFSLSRLIGKGSHGCVYKGVLNGGKLIVAVKKPSKGLQILQDNTKLDNEIDILSSLRKTPYIVNLVGVSHDSSTRRKLLVMEFMSNGSLHDSLHNSVDPPTWSKRAVIALRLAQGIQLLHDSKPSVVHRDIKSANILFDSNWNPRLADFGLAVRLNDPDSLSQGLSQIPSQPAGTIGYLDPSYTTPGKLSTKNDVFSFGVVLLEIFSCRRAIDVGMEPSSIVEWALPLIKNRMVTEVCDSRLGLLPINMVGPIQCMLNIAARCVSSNEESRPSMNEIVIELENCVVVERIRFPLWRTLRSVTHMRSRRKSTSKKTTIIKCTTHQEAISRGNNNKVLSVRDILADEEEETVE